MDKQQVISESSVQSAITQVPSTSNQAQSGRRLQSTKQPAKPGQNPEQNKPKARKCNPASRLRSFDSIQKVKRDQVMAKARTQWEKRVHEPEEEFVPLPRRRTSCGRNQTS